MRGKSARKKKPPPKFMVHPKWTGGGPYTVWLDAGSRERADAYKPMPLEDDPLLFRTLYEAVDYVRDLQSRHMGGGEYAVRNGQGVLKWRSIIDQTSGRDPRRKAKPARARVRRRDPARWNVAWGSFKALARLNKLLSDVQDHLGSSILVVGMKEEEPRVYAFANSLYGHIESARWELDKVARVAKRGHR